VIDVAVVGGGAAGVAACVAAAAAGASTSIVLGGSGASALSCGALDVAPWEDERGGSRGEEGAEVDAGALAVLRALGIYDVGARPALLATTAGIVRPARGRDAALLDLASIAPAGSTGGGAVLLPRCDQHGWDATALARAWNDAPRARARGLTFVPVDAQITRYREERTLRDAEIAERHDDRDRLAWLADRLRDVLARGGDFAAVLLPPWLGVAAPRARELGERVGLPCGECIGHLAGPSGQRFLRARDRAIDAARVDRIDGWARAVEATDGALRVELEDGRAIGASRVVLACGGVLGGGVRYDPGDARFAGAMPSAARPTFSFAIDGIGEPGIHGRPLELAGSLFGAPPEGIAWPLADDPLLERVGLLAGAEGRALAGLPGLYACGDLAADRPRTFLEALAAGARAGARAAEDR